MPQNLQGRRDYLSLPNIVKKYNFYEYVKFGTISWKIDILVNNHLIKKYIWHVRSLIRGWSLDSFQIWCEQDNSSRNVDVEKIVRRQLEREENQCKHPQWAWCEKRTWKDNGKKWPLSWVMRDSGSTLTKQADSGRNGIGEKKKSEAEKQLCDNIREWTGLM